MGRLLKQSGVRIRWVAARRLAAARQGVRFIGGGKPLALLDPRLTEAAIIILTTSDGALAEVAKQLAGRPGERKAWRGKVVLHTCGSLPSGVLQPLKRQGAAIGALHPFQTVPSPSVGVRNLRGCYWAIEGDPAAQRKARVCVKALEGMPFNVRPTQKTLYHLAAFLVCPTLVTLMEKSAGLLRRAGVPEGVARPMLQQFVAETAANFRALGAKRALTGPAVRGDWATIERHLAALHKASPEVVPLYRELLRAMLRLARKQKAANAVRESRPRRERQ
jgi:predicted short-subunit dehydrogenase-like oxidoreductase (DUF2520 family)